MNQGCGSHAQLTALLAIQLPACAALSRAIILVFNLCHQLSLTNKSRGQIQSGWELKCPQASSKTPQELQRWLCTAQQEALAGVHARLGQCPQTAPTAGTTVLHFCEAQTPRASQSVLMPVGIVTTCTGNIGWMQSADTSLRVTAQPLFSSLYSTGGI